MLQVLGSDSGRILNKDQQYEWYDLTGRELKVSETEKDGVISITLDMYQTGRKTPIVLLTIATITIAAEVAERLAEDTQLEATIAAFARNAYQEKLAMVGNSVNNAAASNHVVSLTGLKTVGVGFSQRIVRDEDDNVASTDVIAEIEGNTSVYVYSPAGVFDEA